jgi:hypothetical protein
VLGLEHFCAGDLVFEIIKRLSVREPGFVPDFLYILKGFFRLLLAVSF